MSPGGALALRVDSAGAAVVAGLSVHKVSATLVIHRMTVTLLRFVSMPAGFHRWISAGSVTSLMTVKQVVNVSHYLWKTLHTSQPLYLSELISHYLPPRSLHSSSTDLLTRPVGITSNFSSWVFSVCTFYLELSTSTQLSY